MTIVNRDGVVCAVAFIGNTRGDEWPGSGAARAGAFDRQPVQRGAAGGQSRGYGRDVRWESGELLKAHHSGGLSHRRQRQGMGTPGMLRRGDGSCTGPARYGTLSEC